MTSYWVDVVSLDHAEAGMEQGIIQADHGRSTRLSRMSRGDGVVLYSPRTLMVGGKPVQSFTALGTVADDECYQVRMSEDFHPWRRAVDWLPAERASARDLLEQLSFTRGQKNWGLAFRRGFFEIPAEDWAVIAEAMGRADLA